MAAVQRVIDLPGSGRITDHDEFVAVLSAELLYQQAGTSLLRSRLP